MNLQILSRLQQQPWAMQQNRLADLTPLIIDPAIKPKGAQGFKKESRHTYTAYDYASHEYREFNTQAGYEWFNYQGGSQAYSETLPIVPPNTVVFLIWGTLGRAWTENEKWWLDAIDVDDVTAALAQIPTTTKVVFWFRSPGGIVTGIPETAAILAAAQSRFRIFDAFSDDMCASAAMWWASQFRRIYITPTADIGSIGVYLASYDLSGYLEKNGVKLDLFKAGTMKGAGVMGSSLNAEQREHLQAGVNESYRQFTADVLKQRTIAEEFMQGQCLTGQAAIEANLADGIFPSITDYLASI